MASPPPAQRLDFLPLLPFLASSSPALDFPFPLMRDLVVVAPRILVAVAHLAPPELPDGSSAGRPPAVGLLEAEGWCPR